MNTTVENTEISDIKEGIASQLPQTANKKIELQLGSDNAARSNALKSKINLEIKMLKTFAEIENEVCDEQGDYSASDNVKNRKRWLSQKGLDIVTIPTRAWIEDREQIYGPLPEGVSEHNTIGLKRDEQVLCVLGKKRYRGTVAQVNLRGIVIKTEDRKRIKLLWESIDWKKVDITRLNEDN